MYMRLQTVQKIRPKRRGSKRASQRRRLMETNRREPFPMTRAASKTLFFFITPYLSRDSARGRLLPHSAVAFLVQPVIRRSRLHVASLQMRWPCCVGVTSTVTLRDFLLWPSHLCVWWKPRGTQVTCPTQPLASCRLGNDKNLGT